VLVCADSLDYNFTYKGPAHEIIFTDTRSWRSYPSARGEDATADLLPPNQILTQIPLPTDSVDRILIVVLTTNAPPVQPIRGATRHDTLTTVITKISQHDAHPDLFEAWEIPSLGFDRLLSRLTDRLKSDPQDASVKHYGQVILLSGDVHHSFATRLAYRANNRFGDLPAQRTRAAIAQLVASSYKKQDDNTVGFQREGYFFVPKIPSFTSRLIINKDMTEGYVGWNVPQNIAYSVGSYRITPPPFGAPRDIKIRPITSTDPTIQVYPDDRPINLTTPPDYGYRFDYLVPSSQSLDNKAAAPIPPMPGPGSTPAARQAALQTFNAATGHYREHNLSAGNQKIIGRNNISELTFDWGPRDSQGDHKRVNHTVRWRFNRASVGDATPDPDFPLTFVVWTTYTVSLDPNDSNYDLTKAGINGL
jgi:hypothetical protein